MAAPHSDRIAQLKRIIVLGASGQVGKPILLGLRQHFPDVEVMGTARQGGSSLAIFDPWKDDWARLGRADVLVNSIGAIRPEKAFSLKRVHEEMTGRILENRARLGSPRILQISALGANPDHFSQFLATKGRADARLLCEPDTGVLRPSIVCTPGTVLEQKLRMLIRMAGRIGGVLAVPRSLPEVELQPVRATDLAEAVARLSQAETVSGVLNVVGPVPVTFAQLLAWSAAAVGKPSPRFLRLPDGLVRFGVNYLVDPLFPNLISREQLALLMNGNTADASPLERLLGRKPEEVESFFRSVR